MTVVHFSIQFIKHAKTRNVDFCVQIFISHQELSIHRRKIHQGQFSVKSISFYGLIPPLQILSMLLFAKEFFLQKHSFQSQYTV